MPSLGDSGGATEARKTVGPKPHRCDFVRIAEDQHVNKFKPTTQDYAKIAKKYEKYNTNNATFNGKNLADAKNITNFYVAKERGVLAVKDKVGIADEIQRQRTELIAKVGQENSGVYTQNMLDQLCDDNVGIKAAKCPSNLTEVPRVHEKYESASFMKTSSQYRTNLKTLEIIKNAQGGQPILNNNPAIFGGISAKAQQPVPLKDGFEHILDEQMKWQNANKIGTVASGLDLVNYSELYHPLSHHNIATGAGQLRQFPSEVDSSRQQLEFVQNGFYNKNALEMKNMYKVEGKNAVGVLQKLDPRLADNPNMLAPANHTVQPNHELLREIQEAQQMRAFQRARRTDPSIESFEQFKEVHYPESFQNDQSAEALMAKKSFHESQFASGSLTHHQSSRTTVPSNMPHQMSQDTAARMDSCGSIAVVDHDPHNQHHQSSKKNMFSVRMEEGESPDRHLSQYRPQPEECRMSMEPVSEYKPREAADSEEPSEYNTEQKSMGYSYQQQQQPPLQRQEAESSEDEAYDPRLESKINKIKRDLHEQKEIVVEEENDPNRRYDELQQRYSQQDANQVDSRLEEVLRRQKERLDNMSGNFAERISQNDRVNQNQYNYANQSASSGSPLKQSAGVGSQSTDNIEKAYEELAREIKEIKSKMQGSVYRGDASPSPQRQEGKWVPQSSVGTSEGMSQLQRSSALDGPRYEPSNSFGANVVTRGNLASSAGRGYNYTQSHGQQAYEEMRMAQSQNNTYGQGIGLRSSSKQSPSRSGAGMTGTQGAPVDLDEQDYSLSVSDLNSNSMYRSRRT